MEADELARLLEEHFGDHPRLQLVDVGASYTWTSALNASIAALRWSGQEFQFVLPVSVEAQFSAEDIDAMLTAALEPGVAVVGTTFSGLTPDGERVEFGSSYSQPRNTGLVLNWERLGETMWFDSVCDDLGGMEDFEFMVRLRGLGNKRVVMLDLQVPLSIGVHYNQQEKERRERAAIAKISQHYRKLAPEGSPARARIDSVLSELAEKWGLSEEDLNRPLIDSIEAEAGQQAATVGTPGAELGI